MPLAPSEGVSFHTSSEGSPATVPTTARTLDAVGLPLAQAAEAVAARHRAALRHVLHPPSLVPASTTQPEKG